jgi:hypothetical protein
MHGKLLYTERQTFQASPIIWVSLVGSGAAILWFTVRAYMQLSGGEPMGDNPMSDTGLIIFVISFILLIIGIYAFIFSHVLEIKVDEGGIYYRFSPYHTRTKYVRWEELEKYWVRKYDPIMEYGGWGYRISFSGKNGRAYNIRGNKGLQLEFKGGKRLLLGTQQPLELEKVLSRIKNNVE